MIFIDGMLIYVCPTIIAGDYIKLPRSGFPFNYSIVSFVFICNHKINFYARVCRAYCYLSGLIAFRWCLITRRDNKRA